MISKRNSPLPYLALLACLGISACSGGIPGVYRIPIQQGNVITVQMLQDLELGMDKRKVKFVLGTPLVTDAFHLDRWDYYYSYKPGHGDTVQQRASLFFDNDRLVRIDADIDSGIDFHTVTHATDKVLIVPQREKGGFFAAVTPAFISRDAEEQAQEAIERSLDSGFNEPQPGSEAAGGDGTEVLDPALIEQAAIGPQLEDATVPSEIYVPNTPADVDTVGAPAPRAAAASEVVSAETASRSRFLERLFDDFASSAGPPTTARETPVAESESVILRRRVPPQDTKD